MFWLHITQLNSFIFDIFRVFCIFVRLFFSISINSFEMLSLSHLAHPQLFLLFFFSFLFRRKSFYFLYCFFHIRYNCQLAWMCHCASERCEILKKLFRLQCLKYWWAIFKNLNQNHCHKEQFNVKKKTVRQTGNYFWALKKAKLEILI